MGAQKTMTTDIQLTTDRDIKTDGTGDLATRSGDANTKQQHANACFRAGERLNHELATPEALEDFRVAVRREILSIPAVQSIEQLAASSPSRTTIHVDVRTDALAAPFEQEVAL